MTLGNLGRRAFVKSLSILGIGSLMPFRRPTKPLGDLYVYTRAVLSGPDFHSGGLEAKRRAVAEAIDSACRSVLAQIRADDWGEYEQHIKPTGKRSAQRVYSFQYGNWQEWQHRGHDEPHDQDEYNAYWLMLLRLHDGPSPWRPEELASVMWQKALGVVV